MDLKLFFACTLNLFYYVPNLLASPVIGGQRDVSNDYKYHVSIQINYNPVDYTSNHLCGGALITRSYVLSAAHTFTTEVDGQTIFYQPGILKMVVLVGTRNTHRSRPKAPVSKIFIPGTYAAIPNAGGLHMIADIAVLKIDLNAHENINPVITIPLDEGGSVQDYGNEIAYVMGNGCSKLQTIDALTSIDHQRRLFSATRYFLKVKILERNSCPEFNRAICAISADTSSIRTCASGDAGSPLVYDDRVIGIYSQGYIVYSIALPTEMIFTRVSIHRDFIRKAMDPDDEHVGMHVLDR